MEAPKSQFTVPDIFSQFPWFRDLSKHSTEVIADCTAWAESFRPFDEEGLKGLRKSDLPLLGALTYTSQKKEITRLGCDLMILYYVIDEYTDVTDGEGANKIREIVMDTLRNPHKERPEGEHAIGAMFKDFWLRASSYVSPGADCLRRFIHVFDEYLAGVVNEAIIRTERRHTNFVDFLKLRRYTVGVFPTYVLCEFGLDLPEEVLSHPQMVALHEQGTYITAITNDMYSYPMEKFRGNGLELHNSVELVMFEQNLTMQDALKWLECYGAGVVATFVEKASTMPSWGKEVDQRVRIYIDAVAQVVRGTDDWCFEGRRYFGDRGLEIQKTRVAAMNMSPPAAWKRLVA